MTNPIGRVALATLFVAAPATAFAYDEAISPDLSSLAGSPTPLTFVVGNNQVKGTVNSSGDVRDYITFVIPAGQRLSAIRMMSYTNNPDNGQPGNRGFHMINLGNTSIIPGSATDPVLGGDHVTGPIASGTDLLGGTGLADGDPQGDGFTAPLGPGTYSYLIQNTSGSVAYDLEFVVTAVTAAPVPASNGWIGVLLAGLLAGAGVVAVRRGLVLRG